MGQSAGMSALFPVLCTRDLSDGVRLSQRLSSRQKFLYLLFFLCTTGACAVYAIRSSRRHTSFELPLILLGAVVLLHLLLFAFTLHNRCAVDVRAGEVVVWKRGQSTSKFPVDHVQTVTAVSSDMEICPGVHILHARGFVVVFRGLGGYKERLQAAEALQYAINIGAGAEKEGLVVPTDLKEGHMIV